MRILLAEDDHGLGEWLRRALEQAGHRVDWRDDGRLAERALGEADHDVLVLDLGLPGLGGHELVRLSSSKSAVRSWHDAPDLLLSNQLWCLSWRSNGELLAALPEWASDAPPD